MKTQSFHRVLGESVANLRKLCVSTKLPKKLSEIKVFYEVFLKNFAKIEDHHLTVNG